MKPISRLETRPPSRGNRLLGSCKQSGYPVHVVLGTYKSRPLFRAPALAAPLFAIVADHSQTRACCLMPDHLHWLMADAARMQQLVESFKSYSAYAARTLGHRSRLWQRSYWDHVIPEGESLSELADYIVHNPVRRGIVEEPGEYPYQLARL